MVCPLFQKNNYMIFANQNTLELPFKPTVCNHKIERKTDARFLNIIINESLT